MLATTIKKTGRQARIAVAVLTAAAISLTAVCGAGATTQKPAALLDTGQTAPSDWKRLETTADDQGLLPVIVGLDAKARPEGDLSKGAVVAQRDRIDDQTDQVLSDLKGERFTDLKDFGTVPFLALHASPEAIATLRHSDGVASVSEDTLMSVASSGPKAASPQGTSSNQNLADWWDLGRIGANTALNNGYNGRGETVAVLDTGVQASHPALSGKIVAEGCYSTLATGSAAGGCPNGLWTQTGTGAARYCTYSSSCSHGTHVAGTAAGAYGVARGAKIMAVQVFHRDAASGNALSYTSDQIWALKHVYDRRNQYSIAAVNLSIGAGGYTAPCDDRTSTSSFYAWAATLRSVGIATVVAAGNDGYYNALSSPACNSNVVSVGNSTLDTAGNDAVYSGSNRSRYLSLYAPGTHVCSSVPVSRYECWNGTSMAAPHVAGAFALLKQLRPNASVGSSLTALQASGRSIYDSVSGITKPRINVWSALGYLYNH